MARKRKSASRQQLRVASGSFFDDLSPHTKQAIGAIIFVVLATFFALALLDIAGVAGTWTKWGLEAVFGGGAYLAPLTCLFYVYAMMRPREDERVSISKVIGITFIFLSSLGALSLYKEELGGFAGTMIESPLSVLFGGITAGVILGAFALVGLFLTFDIGFRLPAFLRRDNTISDEEELDIPIMSNNQPVSSEDQNAAVAPEEKKPEEKLKISERLGLANTGANFTVSAFEGLYNPPPLSLLSKDRGKSQSGDVKANANIIKRTLKNFNIEVEMDEVSIGPSVTRFALKPAEGVRISKIVGLQNNLELALAASPIRIEAPIPGKSLVGIEVPNTQKATVGLASLLGSAEYADSPKPLLVALGRDITGIPHFANLAKMPHCLIAGTTGSGKSVTIHALIASLLFRNSPEQLRFIMVDPKRVELTLYNGIPHLLTPVITEAKKAILSLKWAIKEMERRYDILQAERVRDVGSYHEKIYRPAKAKLSKNASEEERSAMPEPMPYIVIFIDELADLMSAYPRELEACIVRLAQMSRAVGIHLVLSTQRPSVNVITGLIKANVPSRIALQVASQIDSRTILDQIGAEKLLGAGDLLFLSGDLAKPIRLQSAYITEEELHGVVDYLKSQSGDHDLDSIDLDNVGGNGGEAAFGSMGGGSGDDDDLFEEAKQAVTEAGKASTSYLQRKLRIGYSRAARLMDILEERGVIGPQDGSKPRDVLGASNSVDNDNEI